MRLRLFHKLFLLVAISVSLAAMAMAIVLSLNLKRGFADYLNARDAEQLSGFVESAADLIEARGNAAALHKDAALWTLLLAELARAGEIPGARPDAPFPELGRPRRPPQGQNQSDFDLPPPEQNGPKSRRPRRPPPPDNFAIRLMLFDLEGKQFFGPTPASNIRTIQQAIAVAGKTVAIARLLPRAPAPRNVDVKFLQRQYRDASLLTLLLLVLASVVAYFFARSGTARLLEMQRATTAIAGGDLGSRVKVSGSDEISAMGENINSMALNLQQLDAARRRWLAEISHELRTPLSVLVGELDALKQNVRPLSMPAIDSLSEEAQRIERIVNDLHFLALSDLSGVPCQFAPCDAVAVIRKVANRFAGDFSAARVDLQVEVYSLNSLPVVWDAARITQLLSNILSNSLRYTDAPGTALLSLRSGSDSNIVSITLSDSAPGVPEVDLVRVFEPLFRLDSSRARVSGGSGLGLAVSQSIVRAHGGTIKAATSTLGGLSMQITLPLDASNEAEHDA
jgi:two-component system, OmpR family, sensor histidine kinase BaeS